MEAAGSTENGRPFPAAPWKTLRVFNSYHRPDDGYLDTILDKAKIPMTNLRRFMNR